MHPTLSPHRPLSEDLEAENLIMISLHYLPLLSGQILFKITSDKHTALGSR